MGIETIKEQDAATLYRDDIVKYLILINRRRAFPEIIDGLKPVQRRILYDMFSQGATSFNKRIKSSAIVGDTMKNYHAHGDSSIYTAIEPLANWYKIKVPLIAPKGNWGSLMGDGPAAARYTEAGLSDFCYDCIIGELKDTKSAVDWIDNYTRTKQEPEYLPVKLPILLINGSFGIGVGINSNIPTHNLIEVCEATRALIKNKNTDILLYPDACQPCKIVGDQKEFKKICRTGIGKYKVRGEVSISTQKDHPVLTITSLPDGVSTNVIVNKLNDMIANKELPMIMDISDASTEKVHIIIKLKKGADPNYVRQVLYTKTQVQVTVSVNFQVVKGVNPCRIGYKEYLLDFIDQRALTKFRVYCNKKRNLSTRMNQLIAYIKLIESGKIDEIINMIKKQNTVDENALIEFLIKKVNLNDLQAKFILGTDIKRLSKGYLQKYKAEAAEISKEIDRYEKIVYGDGSDILKEIDQELLDIEKKYGSPRICKVLKESEDNNIPQGIFKVVITRRNFIRKIPDVDKIGVVKGDDPKFILKVDNTENILLFDNKGKVFKLPISKIPLTDKNSLGTDIRILCKNLTADIIALYYEPMLKKIVEGTHKHYLTIVTKDNSIKKLDMEDFLNVSSSGLIYTKLKDNSDEVTGITIAPAELDVVIYSQQKALRTSMKNIPLFKRNAAGNKAMNTNSDIEGLSVIYPKTDYIIVITSKGRINKFPITAFNSHDRARSGVNVIKLKQGDSIKVIFGANDTDAIRIVTSNSVVEIPVNSVDVRSTVATGEVIPQLKGSTIVRCDLMWNK